VPSRKMEKQLAALAEVVKPAAEVTIAFMLAKSGDGGDCGGREPFARQEWFGSSRHVFPWWPGMWIGRLFRIARVGGVRGFRFYDKSRAIA